jgi:hypothetical protein
MPSKGANVGGQNPEFILREFQGMNLLDEREAINDDEFYWCENAIPVGSAKLLPVGEATAPGFGFTAIPETTSPTYTMSFTIAGVDYDFVVFAATGNGYVVTLSGIFPHTLIITGLTSGQTYATPYNNQGILIIDSTGYWDYNVTAAGVLTAQNGSLAFATILIATRLPMGTALRQNFTPATGTGGSYQDDYELTDVTINAAGTGYAVGDAITLTDGTPTIPAQIVVASVSAGGVITGITLSTGGNYPGPTSITPIQTGPTGNVTATTGAGTGATFTGHMVAFQAVILAPGTGYPASTVGLDQYNAGLGVFRTVTSTTVTSSGVIGGTSIAVYAGRVWIGNGRTVFFTDIDSYNSFGGVGGSFTIPDSYLHANITVLFAANNYLYIFGDTSIDALSNVTVSAGVTSFSRINVTGSVGTSAPASVFAYYRALVFFNASGIYLLAGATPERVSDKIAGIIQNVTLGTQIYGAQVLVFGELCAAMSFIVKDIFTQGGTLRALLVLFFRGRWWVYSFTPLDVGASISTAIASIAQLNGITDLYGFRTAAGGTVPYMLIPPGNATNNAPWLLKTKLWDGGSPVHEKQSINAAIGANWIASGPTGVQINVDTELSTQPASALSSTAAGYQFGVTIANNAAAIGAQYLGLTVTGSTDTTQIRMLALRGKADRDIMQ